jgi:3-isopropylmalate/(R)-2-methylmalate dehydratase small subunit
VSTSAARTRIVGRGAVLRGDDIDTDRIIPARYLRAVTFEGLGEHAFEDDRRQAKGDHALDQERFVGAKLLVVGRNFGCGSSREHAPQALWRRGFEAFVGESFAEIFFGNCTALGLPCATLPRADLERLMDSVELDAGQELVLDVESRTLRYRAGTLAVGIPEGARLQLLDGTWDATQVLLEAGADAKTVAKAACSSALATRRSASCPSCRTRLASRTATGPRAAIACAASMARGSSSSGSKTRLASPISHASSAAIGSPPRTISLAHAIPTRRTRRDVPPKPGITPSFTSGCPKRALLDA